MNIIARGIHQIGRSVIDQTTIPKQFHVAIKIGISRANPQIKPSPWSFHNSVIEFGISEPLICVEVRLRNDVVSIYRTLQRHPEEISIESEVAFSCLHAQGHETSGRFDELIEAEVQIRIHPVQPGNARNTSQPTWRPDIEVPGFARSEGGRGRYFFRLQFDRSRPQNCGNGKESRQKKNKRKRANYPISHHSAACLFNPPRSNKLNVE